MATDAVFYDRKHNREVKASQIVPINAVTYLAQVPDPGEYELRLEGTFELELGRLGYKSPTCEKHRNWDCIVSYSDLVFIRFDFTHTEE